MGEAIQTLNLPAIRKREADFYRAVRVHLITDAKAAFVKATIYVEEQAASELIF